MCRGLLPAIGGKIQRVIIPRSSYRPIDLRPAGAAMRRADWRRLERISRLGKRAFLHFDDDRILVFEPRMTGLLLIADPPSRAHLRLGLELRGSAADQVWFWDRRGLGKVILLAEDELREEFGPDRLGPDALQLNAADLQGRLTGSQREIKVALLDQKAIAGIGNLYASEILHLAGVHPGKRCHLIRAEMWERIHAAMHRVLKQAIRYEGSTLADGTYRNALNRDGRYQNHHRVYARAGQACPRCEGLVKRIVQAQRSTFYCPKCQRKR